MVCLPVEHGKTGAYVNVFRGNAKEKEVLAQGRRYDFSAARKRSAAKRRGNIWSEEMMRPAGFDIINAGERSRKGSQVSDQRTPSLSNLYSPAIVRTPFIQRENHALRTQEVRQHRPSCKPVRKYT